MSLDEIGRLAVAVWLAAEHFAVAVPDDRKGECVLLVTTQVEARRQPLVDAAHRAHLPDLAIPSDIKIVNRLAILGSANPVSASASCGAGSAPYYGAHYQKKKRTRSSVFSILSHFADFTLLLANVDAQ